MDEIPWALDVIKALGIAGGPVFAGLWWIERAERRACQKENRELVAQVLTVASQAANSATAVSAAVAELSRTMKDSVSSLTQLVYFLRDRVNGIPRTP